MSNKKIFILISAVVAIVGFSGGFSVTKSIIVPEIIQDEKVALPIIPEIPKTETKAKEPEKKKEKSIFSGDNCPKPTKDYTDESYLNVGQDISLTDKTYIPKDLVKLTTDMSTSTVCVREEVAIGLYNMFESAKKDGYILKVSSGFRSYETQKAILDRNIKEGNPNATIAVAKPGYSEHQLGMAVDLTSPSIANASAAKLFQDTEEAKWLKKNAYLFGFIESYPDDKQDITGYMYEAWHYRYLGIDNAAEIIKNGQTINQFLEEKNTATMPVE